ncbi:glyoxalase superfamily protein [Deinococcus oregonensis]|uniref:Glyoxalase superfamily protein n=1 Tax=Deinococcus oregonensis TaxID=1805970 RepID=A0ABV6AVI2_9DEIO
MANPNISSQAKSLRAALEQQYGLMIKHSAALHLVARMHGFENYRALIATNPVNRRTVLNENESMDLID